MGAADWISRATQRRSAHPAPAERHRRWVITYSAVCIVLLVGFVVLFRHALGLDVLDYGNSVGVAALLGLAGVIALGVALMAATFYSSRSGIDEAARDASDRGDDGPARFG